MRRYFTLAFVLAAFHGSAQRTLSLEEAIAYINDDELVEVTPKNIRLRTRYLDPHERKRQSRADA